MSDDEYGVERCLACEAVVSKETLLQTTPDCLRSMAALKAESFTNLPRSG
jgi:hypothetical protein